MPRKSSPRKDSKPETSKPEPAVAASAERLGSSVTPAEMQAGGPVLVPAETSAPRKPLTAAAAAGASSRPAPAANSTAQPSPNVQEAIRKRAFEIYQQRGRSSGNAVDDWLRAEREVLGAKSKRQPA